MDTARTPAGDVVVGVDGSSGSDRALDWAVEQAAVDRRPLTIVHAIPPVGPLSLGIMSSGVDYAPLQEELHQFGRKLLERSVTRATGRQPGVRVFDVLSISDPRSILLDLSGRAAMVVVGARGRGPVASLLLGSVSVAVSKDASCPVVVMRGDETRRPTRRMVVGVDGTERSVPVIEFAYRMAAAREARLTVLHCYGMRSRVAVSALAAGWPDLNEAEAIVSESLAGLGEKFPEVDVTTHLVSGGADRVLVAASTDCDMVVVGHQQLTRMNSLIYGSTAPAVLEHAHGAVAVVPTR